MLTYDTLPASEGDVHITDQCCDICPQCGYERASCSVERVPGEQDTEEEVFCPRCGYYSDTAQDRSEICEGYGTYHIASYDGIGTWGQLGSRMTPAGIEWFRRYIEENPAIDAERCVLLVVDADGQLQPVVGHPSHLGEDEEPAEPLYVEGEHTDPGAIPF